MSQVFGFSDEELKLLLVAVRQMRRTFAAALDHAPDASLASYATLYDDLYEKLRELAGPLPEPLNDPLD